MCSALLQKQIGCGFAHFFKNSQFNKPFFCEIGNSELLGVEQDSVKWSSNSRVKWDNPIGPESVTKLTSYRSNQTKLHCRTISKNQLRIFLQTEQSRSQAWQVVVQQNKQKNFKKFHICVPLANYYVNFSRFKYCIAEGMETSSFLFQKKYVNRNYNSQVLYFVVRFSYIFSY